MSVSLANLKPGQQGIIKDTDKIPVKLMEMGCLPGSRVRLVQIAPLGDPIYIDVNGSHIAIRKAMGREIILDLIQGDGYE